jgi:hypothetical protein
MKNVIWAIALLLIGCASTKNSLDYSDYSELAALDSLRNDYLIENINVSLVEIDEHSQLVVNGYNISKLKSASVPTADVGEWKKLITKYFTGGKWEMACHEPGYLVEFVGDHSYSPLPIIWKATICYKCNNWSYPCLDSRGHSMLNDPDQILKQKMDQLLK